jgi:hypothetical protein
LGSRSGSGGSSMSSPYYVRGMHDEQLDEDPFAEEEDEETRMNREIDAVFGTWPGRLLNLHVGLITSLPNMILRLSSSGGGGRSSLLSVVHA